MTFYTAHFASYYLIEREKNKTYIMHKQPAHMALQLSTSFLMYYCFSIRKLQSDISTVCQGGRRLSLKNLLTNRFTGKSTIGISRLIFWQYYPIQKLPRPFQIYNN